MMLEVKKYEWQSSKRHWDELRKQNTEDASGSLKSLERNRMKDKDDGRKWEEEEIIFLPQPLDLLLLKSQLKCLSSFSIRFRVFSPFYLTPLDKKKILKKNLLSSS